MYRKISNNSGIMVPGFGVIIMKGPAVICPVVVANGIYRTGLGLSKTAEIRAEIPQNEGSSPETAEFLPDSLQMRLSHINSDYVTFRIIPVL